LSRYGAGNVFRRPLGVDIDMGVTKECVPERHQYDELDQHDDDQMADKVLLITAHGFESLQYRRNGECQSDDGPIAPRSGKILSDSWRILTT
jgi:hypothetical protein